MLAIAGISVGLLFLEAGIRLFLLDAYITPATIQNSTLQYEPSIFARHIFPRRTLIADGWNGSQWYINEKGYRGPDFTTAKPAGTIRIIFYGGSTTFNSGSPRGLDWPHRVETILRQNGHSNVQIVNAGIPGHASFDSVGRLFSEGHVFEPDIVVLYNAWNDIKYFRSQEPLLRQYKPYVESSDPRRTYRNRVDQLLSDHSHFYALMRMSFYKLKLNVGTEGTISEVDYSSQISDLGLAQYRLNVATFIDIARSIGAEPVLMTQGRLVTSGNTEEQKTRIAYRSVGLTHDALIMAFDETDEIIQQVATLKGATVIDVSRYLSGRDEIFRDHVHLTERGADELAHLVANQLNELLESG